MRIAYLTQSYPPIPMDSAVRCAEIAESMAQNGHQVLVIAASEREYAYHVYRENITIIFLLPCKFSLSGKHESILFSPLAVLRNLYKFRADEVVLADKTVQLKLLGYTYSFIMRIPAPVLT